ncbi:ERV/ALR sulfhydryl oxidase [Fadolivirus algeromassiliense]|jgi:hypothetical protein|uniref:Sulfhydryl oxidase n=1 Tax=Fadolivirus FV1/VV64 TaxID=3070911 RepID=A0A7D3V5Q0_9VIRU|nr:ERV/ALR sulfhydryl oxidase [Fadolivirus algeromassiliense]QKF94132.1 ERV/ALR sulfhydryl oxidase [Fadolivirus FV1/VV64]
MSQQYSSPKIWGPHFWFILRCVAHNYPLNPTQEDAQHVKTFFNELQFVLPCEVCKYTFRQHFNKNPIEKGLANRGKLIEWVELIYQETKKVIQDKRVKIMDIFEEDEEIKPIKVVYKPRIDPLEEKLNQIRQNVINNEKKAIPLQIPMEPPKQLNQPKQIIPSIPKFVPQKTQKPKKEGKVHNMNTDEHQDFGKVQHANRLLQNKHQPYKNTQYNFNEQKDFTSQLEKLTTGKKPIQEINKQTPPTIQQKTIQQLPYNPTRIENKPQTKVEIKPTKPLMELKYDNSSHNIRDIFGPQKINIPPVKKETSFKQSHIPNQREIVPRNAVNELIITRRCKKCEH